jgi:aspartate aminotransferase
MTTMTLKINKRVQKVLGSSTLAITAKAKELKDAGRDVVNFAGGEPDFDTPEPIKQAGIAAITQGKTKYTPSVGTPELRSAICEKFKKDNNLTYKPSQVVVSCGAKHSIFNLIQVLIDEGDEVILPSPYWVSYPEMVKIAGGVSKIVATTPADGFKLTAAQLQAAATPKTRMLILSSPSNPTGMLYSRKELGPIADFCAQRGIWVISDEIYEKLIYTEEAFTSIASLGSDIFDLTFTVNGVSKAYAMTGWRIGYAAGNPEVMEYVKKLQDHSTSNPASISQEAALAALRAPKELTDAMTATFRKRMELICSLVDGIDKVSYVRPQGAFYLFCDFSKLGDSEAAAKRILEEANVAVIPGDSFGAPGYLRLSFATSEERIKEGIKRIGEWVKKNS